MRLEMGLLLEYGWVLIVLIGLEGILAADNALVMSIMVKHLPEDKRKKALFYGLAGAFVFRFASLFIISFLADVWYVQAIGAFYLLYISINHIVKQFFVKKKKHLKEAETKTEKFWVTVLKVELADIAFAVDAILAAVALALTLPETNLPNIGGWTADNSWLFSQAESSASSSCDLRRRISEGCWSEDPLGNGSFLIVGWVGIKLAVYTLAHPDIAVLEKTFPKSTGWKLVFWGVLILIAVLGWFLSKEKSDMTDEERKQVES